MTDIAIGPRLEELLLGLELKIRAEAEVCEPEDDELDEEERFDIRGVVCWGDLDLDLNLVAGLLYDTPDLLLLRFPYYEGEEGRSLHAIAEEIIEEWLIEELERQMLGTQAQGKSAVDAF